MHAGKLNFTNPGFCVCGFFLLVFFFWLGGLGLEEENSAVFFFHLYAPL